MRSPYPASARIERRGSRARRSASTTFPAPRNFSSSHGRSGLEARAVFHFTSPQAVGRRTADAYIDNEAASFTMWQAATRLAADSLAAKEVARRVLGRGRRQPHRP
jgi:hypothetical protein